jgi:hypothetical protein
VAPPPSCHGCQAPQALPTGTRLVSQRAAAGVLAQEVRMPAVPSSPCLRPRPASGVQCPVRASSVHACLSTRPVSTVRYGRLSVQVSGARCPVWASGVRAFPRPLCPTGVRPWRAAVGHAAAWLGMGRGSAWSPAVSMTGSSSARVGTWRSRLAQAVLGQRRRRLGLGVVVGPGWPAASSTAWPTRIGRMRTRIARWVGSRGAQRGGDYAPWSSWEPRAGLPGLREPPWAGLRRALAAGLRPQYAVSAADDGSATL